jgi:hypothetical protein
MPEAPKLEKFQRLIFAKMEDKLSLLQAGRQCVGSDFTSVGV